MPSRTSFLVFQKALAEYGVKSASGMIGRRNAVTDTDGAPVHTGMKRKQQCNRSDCFLL